jgi:hypothetical protein
MAGRKVLILEMRVRHLPPEPSERRRNTMQRDRLKLVVPENRAAATTGDPKDLPTVTERLHSGIPRLSLVESDDGAPPEDAA